MEQFVVGEKYTWGIFIGLITTYTNYGTIRRDLHFRTDKLDSNKTPIIFRLFKDEVPNGKTEVNVELPKIRQSAEFIVDGEQLAKLKRLGFNPNNMPYTETPTLGWALRWVRDNFGIAHTIYPRHMQQNDVRFSLGHIIQPINSGSSSMDLSNGRYDETDGVINTIEELEFAALDFAIDFILEKGGVLGYWKYIDWVNEMDEDRRKEMSGENDEPDTNPALEL